MEVLNDTLAQAKRVIYSADLSAVTTRLIEVEKWSKREAEMATQQYRNYLFLRRKYPEYQLPPSRDIDEVWHIHVLHTKQYREFCQVVFSNEVHAYLDHHPQVATETDKLDIKALFEQTQALYYQEFGEYIYQVSGKSFMRKSLEQIIGLLADKFPRFAEAIK
jgi:hypothetical protein